MRAYKSLVRLSSIEFVTVRSHKLIAIGCINHRVGKNLINLTAHYLIFSLISFRSFSFALSLLPCFRLSSLDVIRLRRLFIYLFIDLRLVSVKISLGILFQFPLTVVIFEHFSTPKIELCSTRISFSFLFKTSYSNLESRGKIFLSHSKIS